MIQSNQYNYMLLSRLVSDCEYYLGNGNYNKKHLWAGNVNAQIHKMIELWNSFPSNEKPEWCSLSQIQEYQGKMAS